MSIRMTLPMPPTLTNSGKGRSRHWRALEREKKAYWRQLDMLVYVRKIPRAPKEPIWPAEIEVTLHVWNLMDMDGAMARMKWPLDWLRKSGYIVGDSPRSLKWAGLPDQVVNRREPRIELELRPATEARRAG